MIKGARDGYFLQLDLLKYLSSCSLNSGTVRERAADSFARHSIKAL